MGADAEGRHRRRHDPARAQRAARRRRGDAASGGGPARHNARWRRLAGAARGPGRAGAARALPHRHPAPHPHAAHAARPRRTGVRCRQHPSGGSPDRRARARDRTPGRIAPRRARHRAALAAALRAVAGWAQQGRARRPAGARRADGDAPLGDGGSAPARDDRREGLAGGAAVVCRPDHRQREPDRFGRACARARASAARRPAAPAQCAAAVRGHRRRRGTGRAGRRAVSRARRGARSGRDRRRVRRCAGRRDAQRRRRERRARGHHGRRRCRDHRAAARTREPDAVARSARRV